MTDRSNQHFVPQFYFRHFSSDGRTINTLLTRNGRIIRRAPIKGQCARRNFYGSKELESVFSEMEARHCLGIRAALDVANNASSPDFTDEELFQFFQGIMFQRGRTALEINKSAPANEKLLLYMFTEHLKRTEGVDRLEEIIHYIKTGKVTVSENPCATVARSLSAALDSTLGITDLQLCLLRNRTDYPFIFSDAPVVFYNTHCRDVRNRGVLGVQCPGLQIFFPLNPWTLAMLFDGEKYKGPFCGFLQHDLFNRSDVSQLNALQLHHSLNAVYFGHPQHEEYVGNLWNAHRSTLRSLEHQCVIGANFWIDGKPPDDELIQIFEPQIEYNLKLSFIDAERIPQEEYVFTPRSPELRDELRQRRDELSQREEICDAEHSDAREAGLRADSNGQSRVPPA